MAALVVTGLLPAAGAGGHETAPTIVPVIDGFTPAVEGVEAVVQASQDATLLTLTVAEGVEVEVVDDEGRAWARITADEVTADLANPAFHAARSPVGAVPDPLPEPEEPWTVVRREGRLQWFEHRLHPAELDVDPAVLAGDEVRDVAAWQVPLRVDGRAVVLEGRLRHVPRTGMVQPRLRVDRELAPGVTVEVAPGPVPALFLRNESDVPVTVLSRDGSPYAVIDGAGVAVNVTSSTWVEQQRAEAEPVLDGGGLPEGPEFVRLSGTPSHTWLDSRAALPGILPPEEVRSSDEEVVLREWSIPVQVGEELVAVTGASVWVPFATEDTGGTPAFVEPAWVVAAAVALVLAGLWVRRRTA